MLWQPTLFSKHELSSSFISQHFCKSDCAAYALSKNVSQPMDDDLFWFLLSKQQRHYDFFDFVQNIRRCRVYVQFSQSVTCKGSNASQRVLPALFVVSSFDRLFVRCLARLFVSRFIVRSPSNLDVLNQYKTKFKQNISTIPPKEKKNSKNNENNRNKIV